MPIIPDTNDPQALESPITASTVKPEPEPTSTTVPEAPPVAACSSVSVVPHIPETPNAEPTSVPTSSGKKFYPSTTKNGRNLCAHCWLKQLMPNGSSQDFKVYWDSLDKISYDIEASKLVASGVWTANTVETIAKFSCGTVY